MTWKSETEWLGFAVKVKELITVFGEGKMTENIRKVGFAVGRCPRCGKLLMRRRPAKVAVCNCWMYCPICGSKMQPYVPPSDPRQINKGDLETIMVCQKCGYKSKAKPAEVPLH